MSEPSADSRRRLPGRFGVQFGYNFVLRGNILAGIEVETGNMIATLTDASLNARLGFIARDRILLYAEAGIGTQVAVPLINVGGGVEIAVGGDMSLFAEAKGLFVVGGGFFGTTYATGLNFHPGGSMMAASDGFQGLYFGTFGGFTTGFSLGEFGVQFGYNVARGNFVGGVEVETSYAFIGGALTNASLNARLGFALRDAILIYGETGFGVYLAVPIVSAGGGIEYAFANNNLSLFTEAKALFAIGGAYGGTQIRAGLNYGVGGY